MLELAEVGLGFLDGLPGVLDLSVELCDREDDRVRLSGVFHTVHGSVFH